MTSSVGYPDTLTGMAWDVTRIPDLTGQRFVVTGANSGLGRECALALGAAGAMVTLACRDVMAAQPVARRIGANAEVRRLDLADQSSIRDFARAVGEVDVLINNAGVMGAPKRTTRDGFELQFGTNHLGHFALTGLLIDRIGSRVLTLTSAMHRLGRIDFGDPNYERRKYERWTAYGQSKLANLMFANELARRLAAAGSPVASMAAHPGYAATGLQGHTESVMDVLLRVGNAVLAQSAADGALPALFAATSPDAESGVLYGPGAFGGLRGAPKPNSQSGAAKNAETARRLWTLSEDLTGVRFGLRTA